MIKLVKYLKPFAIGFLITLAILFVQAICELNLPNLMSDIVNVGLQQNGLEHASPEAISQEGMQLITTFMDSGEKELVSTNYRLVAKDDNSYAQLYPQAGVQFYVKEMQDSNDSSRLDAAFGIATWTMINSLQAMGSQSGSETGMQISTMDISKLYQILPLISQLPPQVLETAHQKALESNETIRNQSGIMLSQLFLVELGADMRSTQSAYILAIGVKMLLIALLGGLATIMVSFLSSRIAARIAKNLRKDVFEKIESFSNNEFDKFSSASLITRCTNDITQIQRFFMMGIRMICYAPIIGIGGVIMALDKSVSMSWIIAVACLVLIGTIMVLMSIVMPKFKAIQILVDKLNLVSRENLTGLMVIRSFGTQDYEKKRFEVANDNLTGTTLFVNRVMSLLFPLMTLVMSGVSLAIVWVGARQIANSALQVGDMMAFMQYSMQIIMAFLMLSMMFILAPRAVVSATRIAEILETENSIVDPKESQAFDEQKKGLLEFRNVSFRYHGAEEDALQDISFVAEPGKMTAIIGSTGSGKSTIANMAMRFYDVTEGAILLDGVDIRQVRQKDLRDKIGYVPQKGILLSGTIASNLLYGKKDATEEEVQTAATVAQAMDFINEKSEGFASEISQGGSNVSGGQKQRLSIARALIKNPEVFIFDDSFSALDFKTDMKLRKALKEHTGTSTVLIIAQRVSTIMKAEQIIVLDEGKIVGKGTHSELLEKCPQYYEIASSQLSEEELA
ncbi:ABC-type multidrug transport system, ATPase and permease component [Sphaerochaeta pleomorpha str. Grapes]|uniref:ABC-type multidrug transport system, ATPase and permease component n=1 Tax=Sphaerochaeta pleomorpha (strain ATCC BAA-1885 / DSM 22778 / Grapes) TaxID=158190 RepID=G8QUJ0_SPHPG|nr:ABC transporter ATP-binding protein [Sphaerochaeta pleomorpha]AEV29223.1 ABC-type multidrug transport system, ATPase and permease component [Sphaerochaeta pleomorpha str. Grapes]